MDEIAAVINPQPKVTITAPANETSRVFSDGTDTVSWLTADQGMEVAQESDAVGYGVAIGPFVEIMNEMKARYIVSY